MKSPFIGVEHILLALVRSYEEGSSEGGGGPIFLLHNVTYDTTKEVILAGGAIGSPQVLMLSGVGPKDVLDAVNIAVNVELPGVGQHLQDHIVSTQFGFAPCGCSCRV